MTFEKDNIPWNKGLKGYMFGRTTSEETKRKISIANKGKIGWNKGTKGVMKANKTSFKKGRISNNKGKKLSVETKQKLSVSLKQKYKDGYVNPLKGKTRSLITRKKHSETLKELHKSGKLKISGCAKLSHETNWQSGEKSHFWKGGKSFEEYPKEFNRKLKEQIRERDNYTCQECKWSEDQLETNLSIHHINYNKQNNNPENLISLCVSCHSQTNFNRDDWIKYFKEKIQW